MADRTCIFAECVSTDRHFHAGFPGGYTDPLDPDGPPIPFTSEPAPGVRDYNGALLDPLENVLAETGRQTRRWLRRNGYFEWGQDAWIHENDEGTVMPTLDAIDDCIQRNTPDPGAARCACGGVQCPTCGQGCIDAPEAHAASVQSPEGTS